MSMEVSGSSHLVKMEKWKKDSKGNNCIWNSLIKAGYTPKEIAEQKLVDKVAKDNNIKDANMVKEGQTLKISPKNAGETKKSGETHKTDLRKLDEFREHKDKKPEKNPGKSKAFVKVQSDLSKKVSGNKGTDKKQDVQKKDEVKQDQTKTQEKKPEQPKYDPSTDVNVLNKAMAGWGTDEDAIHNTLKGKSPEQVKALKDSYKKKYGKDLESEIKSEMSGKDWDKAKAMLDNGGKLNDADKLRQAMSGMGTDEGAIMKTLEGKSPKDIDNIKKEYKQRYGKDLNDDLKSELSGTDLKKADLLMKGEPQADMSIKDPKMREADLVKKKGDVTADKISMDLKEGNTRELLDNLYGKSPEERKAYQEAYKSKTGRDLEKDLKDKLSGSDETIALSYLKNGKESDAEKLHRAIDGLGTDEKAIFRTLEGKSPGEREAIKKEYKEKYGKDLLSDLDGDLSGGDYAKAKNLLDKGKIDTAGKLDVAMSGAGTDEDAIFDALKTADPKEREKLRKDPELLKRLEGELSGSDLEKAKALLNSKDGKESTTDKLNIAMAGLGTDEKSIYNALGKASPEERKALMNDPKMMEKLKGELNSEEMGRVNTILKDGKLPAKTKINDAMGLGTDEDAIFDAMKGATEEERKSLMKDPAVMNSLKERLTPTEFEKAELLLKQGKLTTDQKLDLSMKGAGTDEQGIFDAIKEASPEERKKLMGDGKFMERLNGELGGNDLERAKILLEKGKTDSVEELNLAMKGAGTDEDAIFKTLGEAKTDKEKEALLEGYKKKYGKDLLSDLKDDLSTSDYYKAYDMLQKEPKTVEERKDVMEEKLARERNNRSGWTGISNGIMDTFTDSGRNLDDAERELRHTHREISDIEKKGGKVDEGTLKKLDKAEQRTSNSIEDYQEAKDKVAEGLSTAAAVTAAVAITVATGGAGSLAAGPILMAAGIGGGLKLGINKAVKGDSYDMLGTDGLKDFATGAVDGALTMAGPAMGEKFIGTIMNKTAAPIATKILETAAGDAVIGAGGSAFNTAIDDKTWKNGFGEGMKKIAGETAFGAGVGAVTGAAFEGATGGITAFTGMKLGGTFEDMERGVSEGVVRRGTMTAREKLGQKLLEAGEHRLFEGAKEVVTSQPKTTAQTTIHDGVIPKEENKENK